MRRNDCPRWIGICTHLLDVCEILMADSISGGARAAGIQRSTAYERGARIRERATAHGLAIYVTESPDSFARSPVNEGDQPGLPSPDPYFDQQGPHAMGAGRNFPTACLRLSEMDLCAWLAQAEPGDALEYFRGFLSMDRCPSSNGRLATPEMAELVRRTPVHPRQLRQPHGQGHAPGRRSAAGFCPPPPLRSSAPMSCSTSRRLITPFCLPSSAGSDPGGRCHGAGRNHRRQRPRRARRRIPLRALPNSRSTSRHKHSSCQSPHVGS